MPLSIWLKVNKQTDEGAGVDRREHLRGVDGFKDREDQSIGDLFRVNGAESPSAALRFLSSIYPVRHPEGGGGRQGGGGG